MPNPIHNLYKHTMHDILQAYYIKIHLFVLVVIIMCYVIEL